MIRSLLLFPPFVLLLGVVLGKTVPNRGDYDWLVNVGLLLFGFLLWLYDRVRR